MKKKVKSYRTFFIILILYIIIFFADRELIKSDLFSFWDFAGMIFLLPPTYLLVSLLDVWIERETMIKLVGKDSGIRGILLSFFMGTIGVGPLYMTFPIMVVLQKKGAGVRNTFIFMGAWSTTKVTQIMFEIDSLGLKFTLVRLVLNIISIFIISNILDGVVSRGGNWKIENKVKEEEGKHKREELTK